MTSNLQVTGRRWLLAATAFAVIGAALTAGRAHAEAPSAAEQARGVDQDVQALKKELVALNRDLFRLEEELLYPASTAADIVRAWTRALGRPRFNRLLRCTMATPLSWEYPKIGGSLSL